MSTDQITGNVGGATGTPLAGITGTLQGSVNSMISSGQTFLDRIIPPSSREEIKSKCSKFATERPLLASFLLSQIALSGLPLVLFFILVITIGIFALLTGILVGVIGALLFIVFALIVALFVLLPTLFITTFFAVAIWLWGVAGYYIIKWFNEKKVPGIHVPLTEGLMEQTGLKSIPMLSGISAEEETNRDKSNDTSQPHKGAENGSTDVKKSNKKVTKKKHEHPAADSDAGRAREKHVKEREKNPSMPVDPDRIVDDAGSAISGVGKSITG